MGSARDCFKAEIKMKLFVLLIAVVGLVAAEHHPLSDEFIEEVNREATTWTAGRNFHRDTSINYLKGLLGVLTEKESSLPVLEIEDQDLMDLPTEFDARKQWPKCKSIGEIRDQSSCGSCWAISAAEMMSDRHCIHKDGELFHFSTADINSCCENCGDGCNGGYPSAAMNYWKREGVVSGGQYNSSQGCRPYSLPKCEHHVPGPLPNCDTYHFNTPRCVKKCEEGYAKKYEDDKRFASSVYSVRSVNKIMQEIMTNGPVQASFTVYADFPDYKSGVYKHVSGGALGGHAVRMLGWGEENGVKYWLMANSWNTGWGDKGFFKILRGEDECGIESQIDTGIPK